MENPSADLAKRQDRERWLKEQTVSQFSPGEMQPERDHQLKGEKTQPGEFNGHKFREAKEAGWFSCLKWRYCPIGL